MANIKLFLFLFGVTQTLFVLLDFYEMWRLADRPPLLRALRSYKRVIFSLAVVWLFYFAIQLGFSAVLPSLQSSLSFLEWTIGISSVPTPAPGTSMALCVAIAFSGFYVAGFWDYLTHRFLLHSPLTWLLHESHHLPKKVFNGMPGISARPFVAITAFLVDGLSIATLFLAFRIAHRPDLVGLFYRSLPAIIFTFAFIGSASHSCFLRRFSFVHRWPKYLFITTPQEHVLHHSATQKGNFGNFTTLWDRVFGTYLDPEKINAGDQLGLDYDQDFLGAITAGKLKLPARLREEWQLSEFCFLEQPTKSDSDSRPHGESVSATPEGINLRLRRSTQ